MTLMSSMSVAVIYSSSTFMGRNHKSQDVLVALTRCCLEVQQASVEGEILLSSGVLTLYLIGYLSFEKIGKSTVVVFRMLQPFCGKSDDQLTLLGYNPVAVHQISQGKAAVLQHTGLHNDCCDISQNVSVKMSR